MDPILAALPASLLTLVEGSLSYDKVSSDEDTVAIPAHVDESRNRSGD